ncbi:MULTISPECIES: hypothetical protein [Streptomyces]|uniref:hypothetical protein n=1 Tax=Streptomyces TaxID=1883 RepID=UPI0002E6C150|nr:MULTISPECIES: hypothetical protein [Streptomyces]WDI22272.1 hypothetical protein PS783_33750 [Streptomyces enissocaesilis]MBQ0878629.1 hypothetical protein [Streptomyces sp. RT42]RSS27397.1 hypothetical protein EF916_20975 [Streptomyces sp. WAC08452]WMI55990.1 hypothetical protein RBH85_03665 [Streptomyces rochei]WQC16410.1 hypothetical protein TR631_33130 [Streptomyces rochei]
MTDHRLEGPGENGDPVPRDMPDQQAGAGDDPWEAAAPTREQLEQGQRTEADEHADAADDEDGTGGTDVPDTDEAGTGRQGHPHSGAVHPEHPVPDESSG